MRVGFAGTPAFAAVVLEALAGSGYDIPLVLTQPDRPSGRGLALTSSDVKITASRRRLRVAQPTTLKRADTRASFRDTPLDVLLVAAYGMILPAVILEWPKYGCLNVHASLLPRWRGAAPIQRALLAGDGETGITIMQMDPGLDTGPIIEQETVSIEERDTAGTLHDKLAATGAQLLLGVLERLARAGRLDNRPQPEDGVTYAGKIKRREAAIDWRKDARVVDRQVRAFNPTPGAFTTSGGEMWKIWQVVPVSLPTNAPPGTVTEAGAGTIRVACGTHQIDVIEMQPAGGKRLSSVAVLAGRRVAAGDVFIAPD